MTIKLYDIDAYQTGFKAHVLSCTKTNDEYDVVLDQTLFFPTSGGQLCDQGTINQVLVTHVEIEGETIHHYTKETVAGEVEGCINFNIRYDQMKNHSGEHIFSGIVHQMYGYDNVGFHLGKDEMTVDFNGFLSMKQLDEIENKVNEIILKNIPIHCFYVDDESNYSYRSKKEIEGPLRLCQIDGVDTCACCAPHVTSTIEVGLFKVLKSMKYKEGVRVFLACGNRALKDYQTKHQEITKISQALSLPTDQTSEGVYKLLELINGLKSQISTLNNELLDLKVSYLSNSNHFIIKVEDVDTNTLRNYALKLTEKASNYVFVYTGVENDYQFVLIDYQDVIKRLNTLKGSLNVTGGGKPPMVQGKIKDLEVNIINVLEKSDC